MRFLFLILVLALLNSTIQAKDLLKLHNFKLKENLVIDLDKPDMPKFDKFMRCYSDNTMTSMDAKLLPILKKIKHKFKKNDIYIVCGYRSKEFNNKLFKRSKGVAKNSYHITGQALDLYVPSVKNSTLFKYVRSLKLGGAGEYFWMVHVDTGPVRWWKRAKLN